MKLFALVILLPVSALGLRGEPRGLGMDLGDDYMTDDGYYSKSKKGMESYKYDKYDVDDAYYSMKSKKGTKSDKYDTDDEYYMKKSRKGEKSYKYGKKSKMKGMKYGKGEMTAPSQSPSPICRHTSFTFAQLWTANVIEANGDSLAVTDASTSAGQMWPFVDDLYDEPNGSVIGFGQEMCTRLDNGDHWQCAAEYSDLNGCSGVVSLQGTSSDVSGTSGFTVVGGTGDFTGATGYTESGFSYETGFAIITLHLE